MHRKWLPAFLTSTMRKRILYKKKKQKRENKKEMKKYTSEDTRRENVLRVVAILTTFNCDNEVLLTFETEYS